MNSMFDRQLKLLRDLGIRQTRAARIGDIFSIKRHALDTIAMTDTIEFEWQKHRYNSMHPLDDPPSFYPPAADAPTDDEFTGNPIADNPTADNPPADNPTADNPTADNPTADNPPADNPPADNPPADNPPPGASPTDQVSTRCRVVVVRHGCGLLCDDGDPGDGAAVAE